MDDPRIDRKQPVEILIAEDSATQAVELTHHLSTRGYRVTVARNGREALARALAKKPAMIISDIVMPEMDGYTLCKAIKAEAAIRDVPVILLTSLSGPQDVLKGLECGADNFIRKPYDQRYLLSRVEYILMNQELRGHERMQVGVQLFFGGQTYFITAEKQQILDLLISTYESAMHINQELALRQLELARERDLLHTLMDNVPDFIYFKDIGGRFTTVNRALASALGLQGPEEACGKTDFDYYKEDFAQEAAADEKQLLESGDPLIAKIEHARRPDGLSIWLSTTKMLMRDLAGSTIGTFGVSRDITPSKLAEEEIRKAKDELELRVEERTSQLASAYRQLKLELAERERAQRVERETQTRFRFLFANNPLPMWVYAVDTLQFLEVNDTAIQQYGYAMEEFTRMRVSDLGPEGTTVAGGAEEAKHRLKNGRTIDVNITKYPIEWLGRQAVLVVAHDVTEQKRLQREFIQAQKMEAIGTLAAGVAHDFNNLLTVVNGYCSSVMEQLNKEDPIYEEVSEIGKAGERAATLTRQLLAFSRKQISQPRVLDLNSTVSDMNRMLQRLIGEHIELVAILAPELGPVKADPGQIEQVIMNLAVNARDAMPTGGKLTIETRNINLESAIATRHLGLLGPGSYVMLAVSDTGVGMDAETQSRIFEPFFTTKEPGKGTGLGLSTVYGIIEQSGGKVIVYSEPGQGTVFKVYLPCVAAATGECAKSVSPATLPRGVETVLVVEDEDGVQALECRILEKQGYRVLRARNGLEAIHVSDRHSGAIDLLITDVVMPVMGGGDLAQRLTAQRPELKVLFTSGYTDNAIVRHGVLEEDAEFLAKPFETQALARKVRDVLDRGPVR